jgi:hypothetical protein
MSGLRKICKMYGGMKVTAKGTTVHYKWDAKAAKPKVVKVTKDKPTEKK